MSSNMRITVTSNVDQLVRRFRLLPPQVRQGVRDGLVRTLLVVESRVRSGSGVRWRRGMAGLAGRLTSFAELSGALGINAAIGFRRTRGFPYELSQEFGARARGGAMAVPISPIARRMSDRGQGPRDWPRGKIFRLPNTRVLAEVPGPRAQPIIHYALTKSIPPRLRFIEIVRGQSSEISAGVLQGAREGAARA